MKTQTSNWIAGLLMTVCGLSIGVLLGIGLTASPEHARWLVHAGLVIAGLVIAVVAAVTARSCSVLVALGGSIVAVIASGAVFAFHHFQTGIWPIADEVRIAQYGTTEMNVMRLAVMLLFLICGPCAVVSAAIAVWRKRCQV
jgi:hypothetical protein